jgi:hypothetical protein
VNCREYIGKALAGFLLSLALTGGTFAGDGDVPQTADHDPGSERADVVPGQQAPETAANPATPILVSIKIYFKLDPQLTRGLYMGDRWVSPPSFTTTRQPGKHGTIEVRAVGLDYRGRLLSRHLEPEWLVADSAQISVSSTRGNSVTITMQSPAESTLRVTYGEVSETLTIRADYQEQYDTTQLVIAQGK